jgi:hypothetical protein
VQANGWRVESIEETYLEHHPSLNFTGQTGEQGVRACGLLQACAGSCWERAHAAAMHMQADSRAVVRRALAPAAADPREWEYIWRGYAESVVVIIRRLAPSEQQEQLQASA